ncbi:alpha/beta hydrolase [soil metagenome]
MCLETASGLVVDAPGIAMKSRTFKLAVTGILASLLFAHSVNAEPVQIQDSNVGQELSLPVMEWKDDAAATKAIILGIHGATLYSGTFDHFARHLASEGYPVYALDMRGYGRWQHENDKFGGDSLIHYTQSKEDIAEVLGMLRRIHPHEKIYCMGESLGSNMALWLLSNKPELADGAILSSPCIKKALHPSARMVVDLVKGYKSPYKPQDLEPHIAPYLSEDPTVTEHYMKDPMIKLRLSAADLIKSMRTNSDALKDAEKIPADMPLLVVAGAKDQIYKADGIKPFMKTTGSQKQTIFISPDKGHLLLETTHTDPKIMSEIDDWLAKQLVTQPERIVGVPDQQQKSD